MSQLENITTYYHLYHLAAVAGLGAGAGVGVARVLVVAAHVVRRVVLVRGDRALDTESVRMISHYSVYNVKSQYCQINIVMSQYYLHQPHAWQLCW